MKDIFTRQLRDGSILSYFDQRQAQLLEYGRLVQEEFEGLLGCFCDTFKWIAASFLVAHPKA